MKTKNLQAEITRRNKLFKGKTRAEKRVLIAQDVIVQIKAKTLKPEIGNWIKIVDPSYVVGGGESLRSVVLENKASCNCCALGGLFLSCTLFNNKVTAEDVRAGGKHWLLDSDINSGRKFSNGLMPIFSKDQLKMIENAFEQGNGAFSPSRWGEERGEDIQQAIKFGRRYITPKNRLIAIMNNIIKNNGTFIP